MNLENDSSKLTNKKLPNRFFGIKFKFFETSTENTKQLNKFIDTTSGFVDANGFLINCETDGLHILDSKNKMFFDNIQTAVISASK